MLEDEIIYKKKTLGYKNKKNRLPSGQRKKYYVRRRTEPRQ